VTCQLESCPCCFEVFSSDCVACSLPCLHVLCLQCVQDSSNCPECKEAYLFSDVVKNAQKIVKEDQECGECSNKETASDICQKCQVYFCDFHLNNHHHFKRRKNEKEDAMVSAGPVEMTCLQHPPKILDSFCEECEQFICSDSLLSFHLGHSALMLKQAKSKLFRTRQSKALSVKKLLFAADRCIKKVSEELENVSVSRKDNASSIEKFFAKHIKSLREHMTESGECTQKYSQRLMEIEARKEYLLEQNKEYHDSVRKNLEKQYEDVVQFREHAGIALGRHDALSSYECEFDSILEHKLILNRLTTLGNHSIPLLSPVSLGSIFKPTTVKLMTTPIDGFGVFQTKMK